MMRLLASVALLLGVLVATSGSPVFAKDVFSGVDCSAHPTASVCSSKTNTDPVAGKDGLFASIAKIVAFVAGAAATIAILVGSLKYITSGGNSNSNPNKVKGARNTITNAVIGLAIVVFAETLVQYILSKL